MTQRYQNTVLILVIVLNSSTIFVYSDSGAGNATKDSSNSLLHHSLSADPSITIVTSSTDSLEYLATFTMSFVISTALTSSKDDGSLSPTSGFFDTTRVPNRSSSRELSTSTGVSPSASSTYLPTTTTAMKTKQMLFTSIKSSKSMRHRRTSSLSLLPFSSNFFTTTTTSAVPNRSTAPELSSGALTGIVIGGLLVLLFLILILVSIVKYFIVERKKSTHWNEASSTMHHATK